MSRPDGWHRRTHPWRCDWCWRDVDSLVPRWATPDGVPLASCLACYDPLPHESVRVVRRDPGRENDAR